MTVRPQQEATPTDETSDIERSWLDFAGYSTRRALLYFLPPFALGACVLIAAYRLFLQSLIQPVPLIMLITITLTAGITCIISGTCLLATLLTKKGRMLDSRFHGITDAYAAFLPLVILTLLGFAIAKASHQPLTTARAAAMAAHGKQGKFPVTRRRFFSGHGEHCELYAQVPDLTGRSHTISEIFSDNPETAAMDSLSIFYLPVNPEHYRLLDSPLER